MTATATVQRHRGHHDDQPRALTLQARLERKLQALYSTDAATNSRRGSEVASGGDAPTPMRSAVLDTRAYVERTLARLETIATQVLTGGDSVVRVSGWWGAILCPACHQDTLLLDLGQRRVLCTAEDCADADGQPWYQSETWLEDVGLSMDGTDGAPTIHQRQRQRIAELEEQVARWRDQCFDYRELYQQASGALCSGHGPHVCPETGGEHAR